MSDVIAWIIVGIIGFLIGGFIGTVWFEGFQPYCWYGLCIVWGISVTGQCISDVDFD